MSNMDFVFVGIKSEPDFFACEETEVRSVDTKIEPNGVKPSKYEANIKQEEIDEEDAITVNSESNADHSTKLLDVVHATEISFKCNFCDFLTTKSCVLTNHLKTHTTAKLFACNLCQFEAAHKTDLLKHVIMHTREIQLKCTFCEFKTNYESDLNIHMKTHTAAKSLACSSCDFKAKEIKHARIHTAEKPFVCNLCSFKSANKYIFKVHMKFHMGERLRRCDLCEFKAITKYDLIAHMKCHTVFKPRQNMKQNSSGCRITTEKKMNIIHMRDHVEQFACNLCEFTTKNESVWKRHMEIHSKQKRNHNLSTFKIVQSTNLRKHVEVHTGEQSASEFKGAKIQRLFTCNLCEFQSSRKDILITHMKIHFEEKQPLQKLGEFKSNEKNNAKYRVRVVSVVKSIRAHT